MLQRDPARRILCCLMMCAVLLSTAMPTELAYAWGEFTLKDERELGEKFNVLIRSRLPLVQDSEVVDYIKDIVDSMTRIMPPQPFPFTASVLRHNAVNAFACPGGYIFVHTGLILAMDNESEVAGVIAHEMAHVTQRHIAKRVESSQAISLLSIIGALAGAFLGGQAGSAALIGSMAASQAAMLNYSRTDEREADQVGISYLTKAGYPPNGMVGAFRILGKKQWIMGGDIPSYLSTHPGINERIHDMSMRIARMSASNRNKKDNNTRFLRVQALVRARYSDPRLAEQAFAKQLEGPNRGVALMGMGVLASRRNRINDANRYFDEALQCAPNDQLIVREAGRYHYTKGNRNLGATLLEKAVRMNRNDTLALYYHARNLNDLGRTQEALEYARLVLRKEPEDTDVHELLARLYGNGNLFLANLHMAYSALYVNNERRVKQFLDKAKPLAKTQAEKSRLERFEELYEERKEFW